LHTDVGRSWVGGIVVVMAPLRVDREARENELIEVAKSDRDLKLGSKIRVFPASEGFLSSGAITSPEALPSSSPDASAASTNSGPPAATDAAADGTAKSD
jgi:hypothetical protein